VGDPLATRVFAAVQSAASGTGSPDGEPADSSAWVGDLDAGCAAVADGGRRPFLVAGGKPQVGEMVPEVQLANV